MLSAQQAAAKEAAHRQFDYPTRIAAERHGDLQGRDKLPRFRPGVEGIGIAGDVLRVYFLEDLSADLETPAKIEGMRAERVLTSGFHDLAELRQTRLSPTPCGASVGHGEVTTGPLGCLVETPGGRCILSNNHVLCRLQRRQPRRRDPSARRGRHFEFQHLRANSDPDRLRAVEVRQRGQSHGRGHCSSGRHRLGGSRHHDHRSARQSSCCPFRWPVHPQAWSNHRPNVRLGRRCQLRWNRPLRRRRRLLRGPDCRRW